IGRKFRESICLPIAVATLDGNVQTLGVAELPQPCVKSNEPGDIGRTGVQQTDTRGLSLLLGVGGTRPRCRSSAGEHDPLASLQMIEPHVPPAHTLPEGE